MLSPLDDAMSTSALIVTPTSTNYHTVAPLVADPYRCNSTTRQNQPIWDPQLHIDVEPIMRLKKMKNVLKALDTLSKNQVLILHHLGIRVLKKYLESCYSVIDSLNHNGVCRAAPVFARVNIFFRNSMIFMKTKSNFPQHLRSSRMNGRVGQGSQ